MARQHKGRTHIATHMQNSPWWFGKKRLFAAACLNRFCQPKQHQHDPSGACQTARRNVIDNAMTCIGVKKPPPSAGETTFCPEHGIYFCCFNFLFVFPPSSLCLFHIILFSPLLLLERKGPYQERKCLSFNHFTTQLLPLLYWTYVHYSIFVFVSLLLVFLRPGHVPDAAPPRLYPLSLFPHCCTELMHTVLF